MMMMISGARSEALATWPFRTFYSQAYKIKAAHGVDFEDIYFSEIFAGSGPQNTPTGYNQIFLWSRPPDPHGIGAYGLVLLA